MTLSPMSNASDLHLFFTACEDLDTKRVCVTKLIGPQAEQVIKTEYECCSGYALDKDKSVCEQGTYARQCQGKIELLRTVLIDPQLALKAWPIRWNDWVEMSSLDSSKPLDSIIDLKMKIRPQLFLFLLMLQ